MSTIVMLLTVTLLIITPSLLHFGFKLSGRKLKRVLGFNIFGFFAVMAVSTVILLGNAVFAEQAAPAMVETGVAGMGYLAAALVTGLACIGAGIAVSASASAAIGAISEDSKVMGKALIFVALAEGIALYGLLISFMILGRIG